MVGINKQLSEDWAPGVTDFTLKEGIIFIPNSFDADGQPEYWQGDLKLTFTISDDPMKNYLKLRGFSRPPSGEFLIKDFKYTGDDTYKVEKASDILFVARELFDTVKVKNSNSSFDISAEIAEVLTEYDDRFLTNDRGGELVCRITSDGDVYVKAFSISGQTVNLRDLKDWETGETGATFEIPTLAVGDLFELINAYDVLPEGLEETVGYPTLGYVTKHIESSGSWIKFNKYDKPNKSNDGKLWITYYPLSDFSPEYPFWDKMNRHGTYAVEENMDFPIVSAQETELLNQFKKYLDPLITLTLVTKRPTVLRRGQEIVFSASRFPQGIFKVIDNKISTETDTGGNNNRGNRIQTITFANYSDNWARIIANLKNRNDISKAKLAVNRKPQNEVDFKLTVLWGALSRSVSAPNTPENLVIVDYGFNYITISWDVVPDAIQYYIEIYSTSDLETLVTDGYANDNDFSADPLEQGEYLFKVYALNGWGTSDPATITQATIQIPSPSNLVLFYQFNGNYNDDSGNGYNATGNGSSSVSSNYLNLPNSDSNYVTAPHTAVDGFTDITVAFFARINTLKAENNFFSMANGTYESEFAMRYQSSNSLYINFHSSAYGKTSSAMASNAIRHIAITRTGTTLKLYIDGVQLGSNITLGHSGAISVSTNGFTIGVRQNPIGSRFWNLAGDIDNFMIWNTVLSDAQILEVAGLPHDIV